MRDSYKGEDEVKVCLVLQRIPSEARWCIERMPNEYSPIEACFLLADSVRGAPRKVPGGLILIFISDIESLRIRNCDKLVNLKRNKTAR